jgi:Zn finger protein HypA/HybF involved in hydrogenase expression
MGTGTTASGSTNVRDLLTRGVAAAKADDADEAHFYLEWVLRAGASDKQQARAWLWLSQVYDDVEDKRFCLEQALAVEPTNPLVRRGMALLDGRLKTEEIVDPNQVQPQTPDEERTAEAEQFRCPRCNGRMGYTPDGQTLLCEFCGYHQMLNADGRSQAQSDYGIGGLEQDFIAALATARGHLQPVSTRSFQCQSCAVTFMLAPETLSVICPYCDSVYVTETAETRQIVPPQALIPFAATQGEIERRLRRWFKQHKIANPRLSPVVGIYIPVWTFDFGGELGWSGQIRRGDTWQFKSGRYPIIHDDLLVVATEKVPASLARKAGDFDLDQLVDYDSRYLADWPAERYQIPLAEASLLARKQMLQHYRRQAYRLTGGESVRSLKLGSSRLIIESFKLILLPVWLAHYKVEGETYHIVANGQTGTIHGQRPPGVVGKIVSWLRGE